MMTLAMLRVDITYVRLLAPGLLSWSHQRTAEVAADLETWVTGRVSQ
jgi:hypothetical protein